MGLQIVFSDNLDPTNGSLSVEFSDATAFLIEAPSLTAEMEIDCYLQLYLTGINGQLVRNIPLGKISESAVLLNLADTETANAIPIEYVDSGLTMRLLFLASSTTFIYAYIVKPDCTPCQLNDKIDALAQGQNNLLNLVTGILNFLGVPVPVNPVTASAGSTNQLQLLGII